MQQAPGAKSYSLQAIEEILFTTPKKNKFIQNILGKILLQIQCQTFAVNILLFTIFLENKK